MQDQAFTCQVVRANLDAFWSRASGTIRNNMGEIRHQLRYGKALGLSPYPPLGPIKLGDDRGMTQAMGLETRSLEPGSQTRHHCQIFDRPKSEGGLHKYLEGLPKSGGDVSLAAMKQTYHVTRNPSKGTWF